MKYCCLCNSVINEGADQQLPLYTKFGVVCPDCVSKGRYEQLQSITNDEDFEKYKLSLLGL